jgi:energy-coupling factor transporter ATP-binding protein EcfA2
MAAKRDNKNFNPFPGLRPFAPEESDLFFGREGESEEVVGKLLKNKFVTVIGASGSGKSSLIYCGVLPKVKKLKTDKEADWRIITFRPGNDPFGNLADALSESLNASGNEKIDKNTILSELQNNPDGISGAVRNLMLKQDERVLIVVDQFEELFRYSTLGKSDPTLPPAGWFVDFLVDTVDQSTGNVFTIITMRSDFIGECAHYQGLTQLINNSNYLVPHMGSENYRQAIEGPVKYAGAEIDPGLVEILLKDIGDRTDQLPVLQHAMMRTWSHWRELDDVERPINKSDHDSVGTMSNAMSLHANEAYEELSLRGKEICEVMFKTLTEKGSDNKGLRRPSDVKTIKSIAGCTSEELFDVVEKFRTPARSFITPRQNIPLTEDSIIDLSHESLMRLWDRLREWVDDEASSVQMYMRLSEASAMYQQGKTSLWRPPDLQLAINWRDSHKPTLTWATRYNPAFERAMVYLRTSEKEYLEEEANKIRLQKRQLKRAKIVLIIVGTAAILSMGFMLFAFVQKIAADRETVRANLATKDALVQKSKADSSRVEADTAKNIAVKQKTIAQIREAEAKLQKDRADQEKRNALISAEDARKAKIEAERQADSARAAQGRADINAVKATLSATEATRQKMLSIGKAMSIKSLQATGQKDLQTLLAYQAYLFNKKNAGIENDADIYAGLYNAVKQYGTAYKAYKGHVGEVRGIAFAPGKNEFFSSGNDGQILKWSLDSKEQTLQVIYSGTDIIDVLAVSPDASWLAAGTSNSTIRMIPLKPNSIGYDLAGHKGGVKSLIFSYDGKYLYSASLDGKVLKWDLAARTSTNVSDGSIQITSIDIASNGKTIAGISSEGKVITWNPEAKSDIYRVPTELKNIKVIRFKPDDNLLALGDISGNIELWDVNLRTKISDVKASDVQIKDIRFNPILKQMAAATTDRKLKLYNVKDPTDLTEPPITFTEPQDGLILIMQFSHDGQLIVTGAYGGTENLVSRPTHVDYLVKDICTIVSRNLTESEWKTYVGDVEYEKTCADKSYNIKVNAIK